MRKAKKVQAELMETTSSALENSQFDQQLTNFINYARSNQGRVTIESNGDIKATMRQDNRIMTVTTQNVGHACLATNTTFSADATPEERRAIAVQLSNQGVTQNKIAATLGVSQATISSDLRKAQK